jgi:hypothetical protein
MVQSHTKYMTLGEGGTAAAFAALAILSIVIAAKAYTPEYAFHAYLFAAASAAAFLRAQRRAGAADDRWEAQLQYGAGQARHPAGGVLGHRWLCGRAWLALELAFPALNFDLSFLSFGRLRPLHTSAVIFAFGGNVLIATSFYVVQRTCRARLVGDLAPWFVVLGFNFFIVIAGTGYLLGITQSKEYAEPEWYSDLWLTVVWVVYLLVYLGTIMRRTEPHIYVANWFYLAFIHHRGSAPGQQCRGAGVTVLAEILRRLVRRAGCDGAVVVRTQRGRLLSHRRLPRHHVLFHPQARRAADLLLSFVDHSFLVADLPLHLGRSASPALHRATRLDADAGHDLFRSCSGCRPGAA